MLLVFAACAEKPFKVDVVKGKQLYQQNCAVCHQTNGNGIEGTHPPLVNTPWITGNKERLITIALYGLDEKIRVKGKLYDNVMPGAAHLSDAEIAHLLSYVRNDFGNGATPIRLAEVQTIREGGSLGEPEDLSTVTPITDYANRKKDARTESRVGSTFSGQNVLLDEIHVPKGFKISLFAQNLENPRSLALGENGTVFVGTRRNETEFIYALRDNDGDGKAESIKKIHKGLEWNPMGVAVRGKDLYVGEIHRIIRYKDIENHLDDPLAPEIIFNYPPEKKHGEKYIRFGPDDMLYAPVGAPCNNCLEENPIFASITRVSPEGTAFEIVANGVRNSRGFDWHPDTKKLWFSDNGRDLLGDDLPPCEINVMEIEGQHYGYPFWHGKDVKDPEFGDQKLLSETIPAKFGLVAHAAPVSLKFYTGDMFPADYKNSMFVSEHGSWNRTEKQGYRVMSIKIENDTVVSYEPFITGWLDKNKNDAWGRPVDILQLPDGSLLLSDDYAGAIYRIAYSSD
ncbi:MAG: hypothetical protein Mars2KO_41940 [Maribacter sp.]